MKNIKPFARAFFFLFLLVCLLTGLAGVVRVPVNAAPQMDAESHIVISQIYGGGGNTGATYKNDFIELFNRGTTTVDLTGWSVQYASPGATSWTNQTNLSGSIAPGKYYLIQEAAGSGGTTDLPTPDVTTGTIAMSATAGKVALVNSTTLLSGSGCPFSSSVVDFIGYGAGTNCSETTAAPAPSNTTSDIRTGNGCNDTNKNNVDFSTSIPIPNPRNSASPANPCTPITVTNVTSLVLDTTYSIGAVIDITITFSGTVNVTGSPTLLLETGTTDRQAIYISGNETAMLHFNYTVAAGDSSNDLDYVETNSLIGGTITGTTGEAILTLPTPGTSGSLGANKDIVIDTPPSLVSFSRQIPVSAITNANTLTFRVTFSEAVTGVDIGDFSAVGTTATLTSVSVVSASVYDVAVSGGNLANLNGTVGLNLNAGNNIADLSSNLLPDTEPPIDEIYTLDNSAPNIQSFKLQSPTSDTTNADTLTFRATFSEPVINVDTSDFVATGTTATPTSINTVSASVYDVTVSGGNLADLNGTVGLNLNSTQNIMDLATNSLPAGEPSVDETYTVDNTIVLDNIVISEFRTRGPGGAEDEYIELYNPNSNVVDISGWKINFSNDTGSTSTRATIPASTILRSGQYYLIAHSGTDGYSGIVTANLIYGQGLTNAGGIALVRPDNTIVDQVGLGTGSAYKEGTPLSSLPSNSNQSYERKIGGASDSCQDTNDNTNDFSLITPSDPKNYSSQLSLCGTLFPIPAVTTTTITADTPDPSLSKANVVVSVKVTGGSIVPAGKVNITGANSYCTITLNSSGTGSCSVVFNSTGTKTITATYLGSQTYLASSDTESHQVVTVIRIPTSTPRAIIPPPPSLIAINEFVPRPGHDWNNDGFVNTDDEYIEILNHGVVDVNLGGYRLDDEANIGSDPYRLPSITLKPGERMVFYSSETGLLLSDGGDGVRLLKPNGQLADAYNYFVVQFPDQSFCRLPDNGGLDDWNTNCYPTPGLQNSLSGRLLRPPTQGDNNEPLCPIADTLPEGFVIAECDAFGHNIWNRFYWDKTGWYDEMSLPNVNGKWDLFAD